MICKPMHVCVSQGAHVHVCVLVFVHGTHYKLCLPPPFADAVNAHSSLLSSRAQPSACVQPIFEGSWAELGFLLLPVFLSLPRS